METLQAILFLLILAVLAMLLRNMHLRTWQQNKDLKTPEKNMKPVEVEIEPVNLNTRKENKEDQEAELQLKEMLEQEQHKNYMSLDALQPLDNDGLVPVNIFA